MERSIIEGIIPLIEEYPAGIPPTSWGFKPDSNEGVDSIYEVLWGNLKPDPALALALQWSDWQGHIEEITSAAYYVIGCIEEALGEGETYGQLLSFNKERLLFLLRSRLECE
jgi:hypothetical protein